MSGEPTTIRHLLLQTAKRLGSASEARWVVEHALGSGANAVVLARGDEPVQGAVAAAVDRIVMRRTAGEPLQYLLGSWAFRRLELAVDRRVLIPRPETEVMVGYALEELARAVAGSDGPAMWPATDGPDRRQGTDEPGQAAAGGGDGQVDPLVVVDLGTGSGAVALSMAVEGPERIGQRAMQVWAVDDSTDALAVAGVNLQALTTSIPATAEVHLAHGDWFDALPPVLAGRVTLAVANPPYVSEAEWSTLDPEVRDFEPRRALVGGPVGREEVDRILAVACHWLAPWGVMVMELAPHQADDAALRALVDGFDGVLVRPDLAGRARVLVARRWAEP